MNRTQPNLLSEKFSPFGGAVGTDIWRILIASLDGDLKTARELLAKSPTLANCQFKYYTPLHFAAREGHLEMVKLLVKHGANPTTTSGLMYQTTPTERAEDRGNHEVVSVLTQAMKDQFDAPPVGTELCLAVRDGDLDRVRKLLDGQPELVNSSNKSGSRPLHIAVERNNLEIVELLLDAGADIDPIRGNGDRPIHCALFEKRFRPNPLLSGYLIAKGASSNLTLAAAMGDEKAVGEYLSKDPNQANERDSSGRSPLLAAANIGNLNIVRILLEAGADPSQGERDAPRGAALHRAVAGGHQEIAALLLEHGADPNAYVESSGNVLSMVLGKGNEELVSMLYSHGAVAGIDYYILIDDYKMVAEILNANSELATGGDYGALCMASGFSTLEIIQLLIRADAKLNEPWYANNYMGYCFNRKSSWHSDGSKLVPSNDQLEVMELFFENGADPNNANWLGVTYLHKVAMMGDTEKARVLLKHGANLDAIDDEWLSTPLGWAARSGKEEMVKFLLEEGSDPNASGAEWAKPFARAEKAGYQDIADLIRNAVF